MDPISFLGAVGTGASIIAAILKTVQKLSELRERFQEADTTIGLLITELLTIQAALVRIDGWAKYTFTPTSPIQEDLRSAFEVSLDGCGLAMNILAAEVESLANDRSDFSTRARTLLNETNMRIHQQRLHAQVGALQLLIQAVQVYVYIRFRHVGHLVNTFLVHLSQVKPHCCGNQKIAKSSRESETTPLPSVQLDNQPMPARSR